MRQLFIDGQIVKMKTFWDAPNSSLCPRWRYWVTLPTTTKAAEPGENHWMYIYYPEGSSKLAVVMPLLVEAPDMSTGIPLWHPERAGTDGARKNLVGW